MNIPNELKICGIVMSVRQDNNLASSDDRFGHCDHMRGEIVIDSNQPQDHKEITLVHEILEKINKQHEMGLEHRQITSLATCLYQITVENKHVFRIDEASENLKNTINNLEGGINHGTY